MNEQRIVACVRIKDMEKPAVPSAVRACKECGDPIWIDARFVDDIDASDAEFYCMTDAFKLLAESEGGGIGVVSNEFQERNHG